MKFFRSALTGLCLLAATHAWAWGGLGHRLVADIAWDHLTPEARAGVVRLRVNESFSLGGDTSGSDAESHEAAAGK